MKKILSFVFAAAFIINLALCATNYYEAGATGLVTAAAGAGMMAPERRRAIFQSLKKDERYSKGIIAPSYIRAEAKLENGSQEYLFTLKRLGNESTTDHKLDEQDAFRISELGIFLIADNIAVPGISVLQTYPNPIVFADEAGQLLSAHMEHIYNGSLFGKVGDTAYLPDLPIMGCRVVKTSQQSASTNRSERDMGDGFIDLTPQYTLKGRENNEIRLRVPGNSTQKVQSIAGVYVAKVVLILLGFKISGAGQ